MNRPPVLVAMTFLAMTANAGRAEDANSIYSRAQAEYNAKEYAKAAASYVAAIEAGAKTAPPSYNAACCFALIGKPDDAFKYLGLAIERGWRDVDHLSADADLNSIHSDVRWEKTIAACREAQDRYYKTLKEPELAKELMKRKATDQKMRMLLQEAFSKLPPGETKVPIDAIPGGHELGNVDKDNTDFMKRTIEKHGWPGKSLVGAEAAAAAWLLVQHADHEPDFQAKALELVNEAFKKGETTGQQVAYLTDRVRLKQGKPQVYGTQFVGNGPDAKPAPIEDEANVDARRKEVGLGTLEEYAKQIRGM